MSRRHRQGRGFSSGDSASARWRERVPFRPAPEKYFRWRGGNVSRIENLADAVFGFSVTLLVVALEVPRTFEGLLQVLRGFPAFIASFAMLMVFWNAHYRFFRRYGLQDKTTRTLNFAILLLVLFSVYPLKFLFSAWLGGMFGGERSITMQSYAELDTVYRIYGFGLAGIWGLYAWLEGHALRLRDQLQLTPVELTITRHELCGLLLSISVALASVILSYCPVNPYLPGFIYAAMGPLLTVNGFLRGATLRKLLAAGPGDRAGPTPLAPAAA